MSDGLFTKKAQPKNAEELKAYVESKGYYNVTVKIFGNGHFRIHFETDEFKATRNCMFPFSKLTREWLAQSFRQVMKA